MSGGALFLLVLFLILGALFQILQWSLVRRGRPPAPLPTRRSATPRPRAVSPPPEVVVKRVSTASPPPEVISTPRADLFSRPSLQRSVVMMEILGPPRALS